MLGGWVSEGPGPDRGSCWWFSVSLDRRRFPWVWQKGDPKRVIASLEMLALVLLARLLGKVLEHLDARSSGHARIRFSGLTDNQGNAFALQSEYSRKMPMAACHMELAVTCSRLNIWPQIDHTKREGNTWADALTNGQTLHWDCGRRWSPTLSLDTSDRFFYVLDDILQASGYNIAAGSVATRLPLVPQTDGRPPKRARQTREPA